MASFGYNPIAEFLSLKFLCPKCGKKITTDAFCVPTPNFTAETHHDSVNTEYYEAYCDNCGNTYNVELNTGYYGGDGAIDEVDRLLEVEETFADDDYDDYDQQLYEATHNEVEKLLDSIQTIPENLRPFIFKLLYGNIITMMETYLGDTLKREVLKNEDSIRNFVESYEPFSKIEIKLSNLFEKKESLPKYIKEVLNSILYHDLPKIKPIYRDILGVDLGDISELYRAVLIRHDLIHRNGKDKDGNQHEITEVKVRTLLEKVNTLIRSVESQISVHEIDGVGAGAFEDLNFGLPL